jgi:hypothetical protein
MSTQKQIEANRRNSQHSTGPRTPAGKAASRGNAMRSGIYAESLAIRGEDPGALQQLTAEYFREYHPVTARERDLVDAIVRNEWILRRMGLVEAELWNHYFKSTDVTLPGSRWDTIKREFMLAQGFLAIGAGLERLQRRISAVERSTARARAELAEIRKERDHELADDDAAASPQPADLETTSPPIGFVPSIVQAASFEDRVEAIPDPATLVALIPDPRPLTPKIGFVPSNAPEDRAEPSPEPVNLTALTPDPRPLIPAERSETSPLTLVALIPDPRSLTPIGNGASL